MFVSIFKTNSYAIIVDCAVNNAIVTKTISFINHHLHANWC